MGESAEEESVLLEIVSVPSRADHLRPGVDLWRVISILWGVILNVLCAGSILEKSGDTVKSYVVSDVSTGKRTSSYKIFVSMESKTEWEREVIYIPFLYNNLSLLLRYALGKDGD